MNNIASTGFQFATRGVKNQREEVRSFLLNHPSTMAADIDTIIIKFRLYGQLLSESKKEKPKVREIKGVMKTRGKRPKEEESSEIEDVEDILEEDKDDDEEVSGDQQAEDMRWASVRPEKRKTILLKNAFR